MRANSFKQRDPVAEIHIRVHPPEGWDEDVVMEENMWKDVERLTAEVRRVTRRFTSLSSAYVYQD